MGTSIEDELGRHLAFMRWLTQRLAESDGSARRAQFMAEFRRALEGHFEMVEHCVMPALEARGLDGEAVQGMAAHAALRPGLSALLAHDTAEHDGRQKLLEFIRFAREQLEREHALLLPAIRDLLSPAQGIALAQQVHERLKADAGPPAAGATPPP